MAENASKSRISPRRIVALSFAFYFTAQIWPLQYYTNWQSSIDNFVTEQNSFFQVVSIVGLMGPVMIQYVLARPGYDIAPLVWSGNAVLLWSSLQIWLLFSAVWSISPGSTAIYALFLVGIFFSFICFWRMSGREKAFELGAFAILAGLAYLSVRLPMNNRSLGGITPNLIGHYGLAVIVLSTFSRAAIRLGLIGAGLALIYYSQARTVLVSALLFIAIVYGVAPRLSRSNVQWFVGLVVGVIIATLSLAPILLPYVTEFTSAATSVANDFERGAASGLSGRSLLWQLGLRALEDHELLGYGFRTRGPVILSQTPTVNGHSGLINAALDSGIIGAFLLLAVICTSVWRALIDYVTSKSVDALIVFAFLLSYLPTLAVEPNYFNFSHPTSILFILCLVRGTLAATRAALPSRIQVMSRASARRAVGAAKKFFPAR